MGILKCSLDVLVGITCSMYAEDIWACIVWYYLYITVCNILRYLISSASRKTWKGSLGTTTGCLSLGIRWYTFPYRQVRLDTRNGYVVTVGVCET